MKKSAFFLLLNCFVALATLVQAQQFPAGGGGAAGFDPAKMNPGRFYGKVVDENNKGVGYATVRLFGGRFDPASRTVRDTLLAGQLTADNGDFNLEKLPVVGDFRLQISFLGYADIEQVVTFGIKKPQPPSGGGAAPSGNFPPSGGFAGGGFPAGKFEKDLGNIRLAADSKTLKEVSVVEKAPVATLALDRKIFRVDKDLSAAGGTAQDALKNVPSLSVDAEGKVSLRNGAPQIFVDGRPTALSLDQIAADAIESVEVITNPSAKYDAGGGTAGIVNIVLKKDRRLGYNGNLRTGVDRWGGYNFGGDLNARGGKINLFASAMINRNRGFSDSETERENFYSDPQSMLSQVGHTEQRGVFANGRAGVDFLLDNRNTLTVSGNYTRGSFHPTDEITTTTQFLDASGNATAMSRYLRTSLQDRNFRNLGGSVLFKHLFPKQGAEWTADVNFNRVRFVGGSDYETAFDDGNTVFERQEARGRSWFGTFQSDFVNPLNEKTKLEGGIRAALRHNSNDNSNFLLRQNQWEQLSQISDHYKFDDNVFAAYLQGSHTFSSKWTAQAGLRAESSFYTGALTDRDSSFTIAYPLSLFPSAFLTRKLNATDQIQLSYTRRVNRPNFFQTMPFTDFSDSLNLRRGNVRLLPEFTNAVELTYQKLFKNGANLLVSLYFKQTQDLITTYQFTEFNEELAKEVVVTSYANSDQARAFGGEITLKNNFFSWLDLISNLNIYQNEVDASNVAEGLEVSRMSALLKETVQVKLPKNFALQINGEYRTRAAFTPSNNNDPFRGGPGSQPSLNTAQGYAIENWFVDVSLRKDFWHNKASVSLSVQDLFATRRFGSVVSDEFFSQSSSRLNAPRTLRLNFSYRFGKMDASLFSRKNNKLNSQGNDMM